MAISEVGICNLALSHIGTRSTIASLDEASNEARQCRLVYEHVRDSALRAHAWGFATRRVALAILAEENPGTWAYAYSHPTDCLRARYIVPAIRGHKPPPHEIGVSADKHRKLILTDKEAAVLVYTARITDTNLFDPEFVTALSWLLAVELAVPLTTERARKQDAERQAMTAMNAAMASSANESYTIEAPDPDWISARA